MEFISEKSYRVRVEYVDEGQTLWIEHVPSRSEEETGDEQRTLERARRYTPDVLPESVQPTARYYVVNTVEVRREVRYG